MLLQIVSETIFLMYGPIYISDHLYWTLASMDFSTFHPLLSNFGSPPTPKKAIFHALHT